ncbi:MAG TPA: DNA-binding protein YbiB, partial [Burkholderiaceae bacterium]|nr:DNA-binding protein YbiB [Burkholderiaceae bacterium]
HPEYAELLSNHLIETHANALLLRGTEGEPVADPRRAPKLDVIVDGVPRPELSRAAHEGVLTELPVLPRTCDAATTALYIQSVVSGEKPAPAPLTLQVECIVQALRQIARSGEQAKQEKSA